jgi:hypothetical protein
VIRLAERRTLTFPDGSELRTPLLLPSFSSRIPKIDNVFRTTADIIDGPILISAYDVKKEYLGAPYDWAEAVFLDSGGYEISKYTDLSDVGDELSKDGAWSPEDHAHVLSSWTSKRPLVVISYDHPKVRIEFDQQVERALNLQLPSNSLREILLKPETVTQHFIDISSLLKSARLLHRFDIIGVTEKELGNSVFDRMRNLARLRIALNDVGIKRPVHVFGSLDTTTTPFYFLAGADIFDGLTWLRYAFKDGRTIYKQDFGITDIGPTIKAPAIEAVCWSKNYNYIQEMQREMRTFLNGYNFGAFSYHARQLETLAESLEESMRA